MDSKKTIFELELHESVWLNDYDEVTRVPGGFIYRKDAPNYETLTSTFVPDPPQQEFIEVKVPINNDVVEVDFESVDELTKKQAAAFLFLKGYFGNITKKSDFNGLVKMEKIALGFINAYSLYDIGADSEAHKWFGVPLINDEASNDSSLLSFFNMHGVGLTMQEAKDLIYAYKGFTKENKGGIYYDGFYSFLKNEHGLNLEFDEMAELIGILKKLV